MGKKRKNFLKRVVGAVMTGAFFVNVMPVIPVQATTNVDKDAFREEYTNMLLTGDKEVHDIRNYNLTWDEYYDICQEVLENEGKVAYRCYSNQTTNSTRDGKYMKTFWLINSDDGFQERYTNMLKSIEEVKALMDDDMNEMEKALCIHDYVVKHTKYKEDTFSWVAGGPLGLGYGVCLGYTEAVMLLLEEEGIECEKVLNSTHAWVVAKLDGEWYHLDPTWDDTIGMNSGIEISHEFFVRNDDEFRNAPKHAHTGWNGNISSSEKYTDWYVHDVTGDMLYDNGNWYYEENGSIVKNDIEGESYEVIVSGDDLKMVSVEDGVLVYTENGKQNATQVDRVYDIPQATPEPTVTPEPTENIVKAKFYLLKQGVSKPEGTKGYSSSCYIYAGEGKVISEVVFDDNNQVMNHIVEAPDVNIPEGCSLQWYVVKEERDGWHVDGVLKSDVTEPTGTPTPEPTKEAVVKAKFYILKQGVTQPEGTKGYSASYYTYAGEGKVMAETIANNEDLIRNNILEAPVVNIAEGEKIRWYVIKHEGDGWHVDGIVEKD